MYILLAILAFGVLILTHELGHFLVAKACHVKVLEFSMGMGPRLWHTQKGETEYSLRLLPMGGFCAMEGEDGDSNDPRAFVNQKVWKRLLILIAGSFMNLLLGFLLTGALFVNAAGYSSNVIADFYEGCPYEGDLQVGDAIVSVNGEAVYFMGNFGEYAGSGKTMDLVLRRDGKKIVLDDYPMVPVEYKTEQGTELKYGLYFAAEPNNVFTWAKYTWYSCLDFVRMIRIGLTSLFTGGARVSDMAGVVGMVDIINTAGQSAQSTSQGLETVIYLIAFIAVNLAVMNLLPIPALDGGRVFTLLLGALIEKLIGRKLNPKVEGYIHAAGLLVLLGLMGIVMYNDIARIITR